MRLLYILLLCLAPLSACANNGTIEVEKQGTPALWKVSAKPTTINGNIVTIEDRTSLYLFGTIHLLPKGVDWQSDALDFAISGSDQLILETIGLDDTAKVSQIFTSLSTDEKVIDITQRLNGADLVTLEQIIDDKGLSQSALSKMETWAASLAISNSFTSDLGLERELGVETILTDRFRNKPITGLETIASQFSIFDDLSETDQRSMLKAIVNNSGNNKATFMRLLNAWLDGDSDSLIKEVSTGILETENVREALLDGRNRKWVNALLKHLDKDDKSQYFVAVGAAHLVGENGVPELLKSAGYHVERIQ